MPRFSANISMLFKELEFPERFEAAAQAGFKAVEIQFPYSWDKGRLAQIAQHAGVEVVLINMPAGDPEKGDRGIGCLPGRDAEFREGVAKAIEFSDRKSTRLNSSHLVISYAVFCLKKKKDSLYLVGEAYRTYDAVPWMTP